MRASKSLDDVLIPADLHHPVNVNSKDDDSDESGDTAHEVGRNSSTEVKSADDFAAPLNVTRPEGSYSDPLPRDDDDDDASSRSAKGNRPTQERTSDVVNNPVEVNLPAEITSSNDIGRNPPNDVKSTGDNATAVDVASSDVRYNSLIPDVSLDDDSIAEPTDVNPSKWSNGRPPSDDATPHLYEITSPDEMRSSDDETTASDELEPSDAAKTSPESPQDINLLIESLKKNLNKMYNHDSTD